MSNNMNKWFNQVAAFQKLWADSLVNMAGVWSQFSPGSPPFAEMGKMRCGMLKLLAETFGEYMRTLNGALDLKRLASDGMNRVHEQFKTPSKDGGNARGVIGDTHTKIGLLTIGQFITLAGFHALKYSCRVATGTLIFRRPPRRPMHGSACSRRT